jgi:hypothetical protein
MSLTRQIVRRRAVRKRHASSERDQEEIPPEESSYTAVTLPQVARSRFTRRHYILDFIVALLVALVFAIYAGAGFLKKVVDIHDGIPALTDILIRHSRLGYLVAFTTGCVVGGAFIWTFLRLKPRRPASPPSDPLVDAVRELVDELKRKGGRDGRE